MSYMPRDLGAKLPPGLTLNRNDRLVDQNGAMVYLCDGSCTGNGTPNSVGGCAFFAGPSHQKMWLDPSVRPTSNTAELHSVRISIF